MNPYAAAGIQPTNIPTVKLVPVTNWAQPDVIADLLEAGSLGAQNVRDGGNLNAFINACESVLTSADAQGVTLALGPHNVLTWFLDPDRDPNPISPGAVGAPLGSRLYCETERGWFFATWFGAWYLIPHQETIQQRPCNYPAFSGCLDAMIMEGIRPGTLPGGMYWRPAANPDMNPEGQIFGGADDPLPTSWDGTPTSPTTPLTERPTLTPGQAPPNGASPVSPVLVFALAGAAALFFLD
jgi:hypothetical protein